VGLECLTVIFSAQVGIIIEYYVSYSRINPA
jgi:hypothetical protein